MHISFVVDISSILRCNQREKINTSSIFKAECKNLLFSYPCVSHFSPQINIIFLHSNKLCKINANFIMLHVATITYISDGFEIFFVFYWASNV